MASGCFTGKPAQWLKATRSGLLYLVDLGGSMSKPKQHEQRELRKWIEELHGQTAAGRNLNDLLAALGEVRDKKSVLRIAAKVIGDAVIEVDGVVEIGGIRLDFDSNDELSGFSTGGDVVIGEIRST
jgi:hypothetical protein